MPETALQRLVFKAADQTESVLDVDSTNMTIVHRITAETIDADHEVVLSSGLNFDRMKKTGSVLFMHDPYTVVAKSLWQKKMDGFVRAKTQFAPTDTGREVFALCSGGYIKGWSIGMDWSSIKYCDDEEMTDAVRKNPLWAGARAIIKSAEVMEYSVASIPANADALTDALRSGRITHVKALVERFLEAGQALDKNAGPRRMDAEVVRVPDVEVVRVPVTAEMITREVRSALRKMRGID